MEQSFFSAVYGANSMKPRQIVAMPLIPGRIHRGQEIRSDLSYAKYSQAAWRWWCRRHGIEFVVFDLPLGGQEFSHMPPTFQRWLIPGLLLTELDRNTVLAIVDADTMVHWDAPNFLDLRVGFTAVRGLDPGWIFRSMRAFQKLFPDVSLPWWTYFNAGIVVLGAEQLRSIQRFLEFTAINWRALETTIRSGNVGTDQTPLNFMLRREEEPVHLLSRGFNLLNCFPMGPALRAIEDSPFPDPVRFAARAFARPHALDFTGWGFVWHFSNIVKMRSTVMEETWRRVRANYPGADIPS